MGIVTEVAGLHPVFLFPSPTVWVNGNWRQTFRFNDGEAILVDYQDYHWEDSTMQMHNPPHPGETWRHDVLPALGLSVTAAAEQLCVTRVTLPRVLNGQSAISPEMALRLERWLGVDHGGRAAVWLGMQAAHDLWNAHKNARAVLKKIKPLGDDAFAHAAEGRLRQGA